MARASGKSKPAPPTCSFCGKAQKEVKRIIVGPGVYICDLCVGVCATIISREENKTAPHLGVFTRSADEVQKCLLLLSQLKHEGLIDEVEYKAKARKLIADELPPPPIPIPPPSKKKRG